MTFISRIFYRNTFLHIGHLQTLLYNDQFAAQHQGTCYAIVDDRQNSQRDQQTQEDIEYLKLEHIKVISVAKHQQPIQIYTNDLGQSGFLELIQNNEHRLSNVVQHLEHPQCKFQIKLKTINHPTIGYSKLQSDGSYTIVYIFDYIIKVLDELLSVNNIVTTTPNDISDPNIMNFFNQKNTITYHSYKPYTIQGFRYTKHNWPDLLESDPRLMTLKGLKSRHIPTEVIHQFYQEASQSDRPIKITRFDSLLKASLQANHRVFGVITPLKVTITNFEDRYTELIMKPLGVESRFNIVPLSSTLYIEQTDFSLVDYDQKLSKNREVRLRYANVFYCTDVILDSHSRPLEIKGKYYNKDQATKACIHWISAVNQANLKPVKFFNYNWFYTGDNHSSLQPPKISQGYIDPYVFEDLTQIYQLERLGYYVYDADLSSQHQIPCFIKVCNIY